MNGLKPIQAMAIVVSMSTSLVMLLYSYELLVVPTTFLYLSLQVET